MTQIFENLATTPNINADIVSAVASDRLIDAITTEEQLSFADLHLAKPILEALQKAGYTHPTPIQAAAIVPSIEGRDLLLSAQTGSGKTAAFVLPILDRIYKNSSNTDFVRAVILTPTRELALQVQENVRIYGSRLKNVFSVPLVGGAPYGNQIRALRKGVQVIVATPGRFIDHMNDGRIRLDKLDVLVLDEADRMLDMGFSEAIDTILKATPQSRQTIMSSATWDGAVGKIAEGFTKNPIKVSIKVESAHIEESVYFCDDFRHKNDIFYRVINNPEITQAVIFASTKISTERLAEYMVDKGYKARYLHGDLPQGKRNRIVSDVKAGKVQFLVATDVAARGIDIATISHVINYDLPRQAEDYVHRIGRCGRAGRTGEAINMCSVDDRKQFFAINRYLGRQMSVLTIEGLESKRNFEERSKEHKPRRGRGRNSGRGGYKNNRGGGFDRNEQSFDRGFRDDNRGNRDSRASGRFERDFGNRPPRSHNRRDSENHTAEHNRHRFGKATPKRDFNNNPHVDTKSPRTANKMGHRGNGRGEERTQSQRDGGRFGNNRRGKQEGFKSSGIQKDGFKKDFKAKEGNFYSKKPRKDKVGVEEVVFNKKRRFGDK